MNMKDILDILMAILVGVLPLAITVAVGVLTPLARRWLQGHLNAQQMTLLQTFAHLAVQTAEQQLSKVDNTGPNGELKKQLATQILAGLADQSTYNFTPEAIHAAIESAVLELKRTQPLTLSGIGEISGTVTAAPPPPAVPEEVPATAPAPTILTPAPGPV